MLIFDRVLCDECLCDMGQLYHLPVQDQERISDFRTAPDYCLCPDCAAALKSSEAQPGQNSTQG